MLEINEGKIESTSKELKAQERKLKYCMIGYVKVYDTVYESV